MNDVFNNPTNNYVTPALSPCAGASDDSFLEFLPNKGIGVVQGTNTLASISFSDIKIPVAAYSSQKKVLEPGEVTFIAGLTKGLDYRTQAFTLPDFGGDPSVPFFLIVDLSIGFYKNFGFKQFSLEASANFGQNITIDKALDIALSNIQAKITSAYDPSDLTFTGTQLGWDFNISHVELRVIDSSENPLSPFPHQDNLQPWVLDEDLTKMVLYAKYPNSAMQGIIMKVLYPAIPTMPSIYDGWIYVNHVPDIATIYEPAQVDNFITNIYGSPIINFDPSITFGPFQGDISLGATYFQEDISISNISQFIFDCSIFTSDIADSTIYKGNIFLNSIISGIGIIENAWVNKDYPLLPYGDPSSRVQISSSGGSIVMNECSIYNATLTDVSVYDSYLEDVSVFGCTLINCLYDPSLISLDPNCMIIGINAIIDCSLGFDVDSSLFYEPVIKTVEIGMSGCSNSTQMSAGDYLEFITNNDGWNKVGELYIWTTAPDWVDTKNLIEGFYAFNPHNFAVQLEYLIFV